MEARVDDLGELPPPWTRPPVNAWEGSLIACAAWGAASAAAPMAARGWPGGGSERGGVCAANAASATA